MNYRYEELKRIQENTKCQTAYNYKTLLGRHKPRPSMKGDTPRYITHTKLVKWYIEESGRTDIYGEDYWNLLITGYTSYDRALVELQSCKWQFPQNNYRIVQFEDVLFRKITVTTKL